ALRRPRAAEEVRVFDSTAEYVAHFVEALAAGWTVEVWYFGPLLPFRGRGLGETLANLARAEPDAWPEVLRLLRLRGLLGALLGRLAVADREVLRGVPAPPERPLGRDEGWPLFLAAWDAALSAMSAGADRGSESSDARRAPAAALPESPGEAFRLYLETHPTAPASWGVPSAIGACVAAMVRWILRRAAASITVENGEAALARHPWIDPAPVRRVLREHAAPPRSEASTSRIGGWDSGDGSSSPAGLRLADPPLRPLRSGAMNRTRALRFLRAANLLASPAPSRSGTTAVPESADDPFLDLQDEVWAVDAAAARLASTGAAPSEGEVLRAIESADDGNPKSPARSNEPIRVLTAAARELDDGERRALASAVAARAQARTLTLETAAAGVFFLIRPLVDLGVPGLATRAGLSGAALRALLHEAAKRAADAPENDRAAGVFAYGSLGAEWTPEPPAAPGDPRRAELARALRAHAARMGLALAEPEPEPGSGSDDDVEALLVEAACRQLVRWMRGFETSSAAYVLKQVVRRPGAFRVPAKGPVEVVWPSSGMDVLLERAGYLEPLAAVPWWDGRGARWER
ncbi:MAG TPA: hypothetical protein VHG91_20455, partial [Longimicrobium sp.]|nr:hypothetical protein [Longimicrobium sp.]